MLTFEWETELGLTHDQDGWYVDASGCAYPPDPPDHNNLGNVLQSGVLGFCNCGCPGANVEFVGQVLSVLASDDPWDVQNAKLREMAGSEVVHDFVLYVLDDKNLLEHGGSIGGSWLTNKGRAFLAAVEEWKRGSDA